MPNSKQLSLILNKVEKCLEHEVKEHSKIKMQTNDDCNFFDAIEGCKHSGRAALSEELLDMISDLRKEYDEK